MGVCEELKSLENKEKASFLQRFFKTGKGEYAEGDIFLGISVPDQRKIATKYYKETDFLDLQKLLTSKIHECRLTGLLILVLKYQKANLDEEKKKIVDFYLSHINNVNNWDLVDSSADKILGNYLLDKDKNLLYKFAISENLWKRRIAIISTFEFIRNNEFEDTLKISEILLNDKHNLIHKAVGWMLREIGNRNVQAEEIFLNKYSEQMPRTMLRYAIEKFDKEKRMYYLKK